MSSDPSSPNDLERLSKRIARAGLCSRREAALWIAAGRVTLDGVTVSDTGAKASPAQVIAVDGKPLPATAPARIWKLHKPRGLLTTAKDPQGRKTIYDLLASQHGIASPAAMMPIGRLDMNSEGLLLLTNDGALKRRLELPSSAWKRKYRVRVYGRVEPKALAKLANGITVDGVAYGPIEAELEGQQGANAWLSMTLSEGKNREIRRICEHLGLSVNRLIRTSYGPFTLGAMPRGMLSEVSQKMLRATLGLGEGAAPKLGTAKARARPVKPGYKKQRQAAKARKALQAEKEK